MLALLGFQVARQILEAHSSMLNMSLTDAKMQYIRNWQALGDFGITYFVIRVGRSRKDVSTVVIRVHRYMYMRTCLCSCANHVLFLSLNRSY